METAQAMLELKRLGVKKIQVDFDGGNDESFVESPQIIAADDDTARVERFSGELIEALEEPIWSHMGDAFGDQIAGIEGEAIWDVEAGTVHIPAPRYLEWQQETDEELTIDAS